MQATGGGGGSRGGGITRFRSGYRTLHDQQIVDLVNHGNAVIYAAMHAQLAVMIAAYLRGRAKTQREVDGLAPSQQKSYLLSLFSGRAWRDVRCKIAGTVYGANAEAVARINDALPDAFAEGADRAAWRLHRQNRDYIPPVYTPDAVCRLAEKGLIEMPVKRVDRKKDIAYTEQRVQAIANAAALMRTALKDLAEHIARHIDESMQDAMSATVQSSVLGAWDGGMYRAARDARDAGLDVEKTWLGIVDTRIRDSHRHLHNTTIPLDALFHGYSGDLRYPHDPKAPPAETRRCRCRMAVHLAGRAPKGTESTLLPSEVANYQKWRDAAIRKAGRDLLAAHIRRLKGA